jgi:hypothetical protein
VRLLLSQPIVDLWLLPQNIQHIAAAHSIRSCWLQSQSSSLPPVSEYTGKIIHHQVLMTAEYDSVSSNTFIAE